jgi:FAD-dependent oxidoreductase domain-containing protein 1
MNKSYDVVIIGGGVTGSASAYFLAAQDAFGGSVLVVERDPTYEHAPSARATGGIRQQFSTPENVRIGLFGAQFLKRIGEHLAVDGEAPDVAFRERGYLLLATPEMLPVMQANHAVQLENGADIAFQSPDELRARFPWLGADGLAGGFLGLSNEGWLDPYALLQAFRRKARSLGVTDFGPHLEEGGVRPPLLPLMALREGR